MHPPKTTMNCYVTMEHKHVEVGQLAILVQKIEVREN
jgi:hypothetical protein